MDNVEYQNLFYFYTQFRFAPDWEQHVNWEEVEQKLGIPTKETMSDDPKS